MLMVLEVEAYIEHREVEKVRYKYSGVTYRFGGSLLDTSRMLDVHARTCPWRIDIVASYEHNATMLHCVKTAEWDFR